MANLSHVIFFSMLGGFFSLVGGFLLLRNDKLANKAAVYATPFAAGALLSAVFLDLLKEGVQESNSSDVLLVTLIGILIFFIAEKGLRWFHHHHEHNDVKTDPATSLIIVGDTLHNAMDGVAIAAAFLVSIPTGIVTTLAVAAHEIPQEIGDFGLLLKKGMSKANVLKVNILSALATTVMAVVVFVLGSNERLPVGILLGLSAGFLLYIALSDVIPSVHESSHDGKLIDIQSLLVLVGAIVVAVSINLSHSFMHSDHAATETESSLHSDEH